MDKLFSNISWEATGAEIEAESFRRIEAKPDPRLRSRFTREEWRTARRLVHTPADFSILEQLTITPGAPEAGLAALRRGALIYCDSNMIKAGLSVAKLRRFHPDYRRESILCPVADEATRQYAEAHRTTRALAAVELHAEALDGAIFLCGNAPLALAGVAVQYALVDGLTAMGRIRYAFPLSVFRKLVYMACIFVLPRIMDIRSVFYAGSISDAVGAAFSAAVFFGIVDPRLKKELVQEETEENG